MSYKLHSFIYKFSTRRRQVISHIKEESKVCSSAMLKVLSVQTAITVQPGDCKILNITSTPTITTATAEYTVPVNGGISMWFADSRPLPGSESQGSHFNWNPTVSSQSLLVCWQTLDSRQPNALKYSQKVGTCCNCLC